LALGSGCSAESLGRRSTQGALTAVGQHVRDPERVAAAQAAAQRMASDAFAGLTTDERRAAISQLSRELARSAAGGMKEELAAAIGPNGEGPLADSLARTVERVAQSAVFPECTGADRPACVRAQIAALTQSSAVGFAQALRQQLGLGALVVAFVAGVFSTLALLSMWTTLRSRRTTAPTRTAATTT
jgi:hypothetical protein